MKNNYKIIIYLLQIIPKYIKKVKIQRKEILIYIEKIYLTNILNFLKNHHLLNYNYLVHITAIDYPTKLKRFEVDYNLLSLKLNSRIRIKTSTNELEPLNTINSLFLSANWYEREVWDMFGIYFLNHPDLRRILTDYGFEGFPLRKDFPQTGFLEVRYDDKQKRVIYEPLEVAQEYRFFEFSSNWLHVK